MGHSDVEKFRYKKITVRLKVEIVRQGVSHSENAEVRWSLGYTNLRQSSTLAVIVKEAVRSAGIMPLAGSTENNEFGRT